MTAIADAATARVSPVTLVTAAAATHITPATCMTPASCMTATAACVTATTKLLHVDSNLSRLEGGRDAVAQQQKNYKRKGKPQLEPRHGSLEIVPVDWFT